MLLADKVVEEVERRPGISDRELSEAIFGTPHRRAQVNGECLYLQNLRRLARKKIGDRPIGNYRLRNRMDTAGTVFCSHAG